MFKVLATLALLLFSATPSNAACVMSLDGADKAIAEYRMVRHVFANQRLLALVDVIRERTPQFTLEEDTTAIWLLELPDAEVGFVIEVNDKCVTFRPEQAPLAAVRQLVIEVSRRMAES
jgi:hypothetical protein